MRTKRLRIFAGPNGSGKSTLYKILSHRGIDMGLFVNADEIERLLRTLSFDFSKYKLEIDFEEFCTTFKESSFYTLSTGDSILERLSFKDNTLHIADESVINSYLAAFMAGYIRTKLLGVDSKFTIETVMSHRSKLDYIKEARRHGYRVYLYFISTCAVELNINRVAQRVLEGGHDVPEEKIRKRYSGSLENLFDAIMLSDRAYIFDNSSESAELYARYNDGEFIFEQEESPKWVKKYIFDKLISTNTP